MKLQALEGLKISSFRRIEIKRKSRWFKLICYEVNHFNFSKIIFDLFFKMCELDVAKDPSSNLSSLNLVGNLKREHSIKSLSSCSKIGSSERITMLRYQVSRVQRADSVCVTLKKHVFFQQGLNLKLIPYAKTVNLSCQQSSK